MRNAAIRIRQVLISARFVLMVGILVCTGIDIYTLWYSSAGNFPDFPQVDNDYVDLGEAFLQGQVSLLERPDPALVALEDPYDPAQRIVAYRWDASYYKGRYYLYWGPVPGLAFAVIEGITNLRPPGYLLVIICYIGLSIILLIILFQIWRYFFPSVPGFSLGLCLVVSLINLPILFLLGRPVVYETSIIAGQFFLFLGLLCWVIYITGPGKNGWLIGAGLNWGLAIGSRYNLVISIAIYLAFVLTQIAREAKERSQLWQKLVLLLIPLGLCIMGLGVYNFARFGNPLETGLTYQLGVPEAQDQHYSISYLLSNLFIYLFYPMTTVKSFPFIRATLPIEGRFDEVVAGLLPSAPSTWLLGLVIPSFLFARASFGARQREIPHSPLKSLFAMILVAALMQFLFLTVFYFDAMRFMADFYLQLALGIWILVWKTDTIIRSRVILRVIFWIVVIGLAFWTTGIGFFAGFDIPPQTFHISNPILYRQLETYWNNFYREIAFLFI
jgi:hypothetical protein